ncbi:MAG: transglutaminase family protein [Oscillospiraceae bacterium]|nr:transglutaminase family protein [Oscillospiraceae bacterium]
MKRLTYQFSASIDFSEPITEQYVVLRCLPYPDEVQRMLSGSITVEPWCPMCYSADGFGNTLMSGSFRSPHRRFSYQETATVFVDLSRRKETEPHPMYRHGGLLTQPNDELREFAASIASCDPERLAAAVADHFAYRSGVTGMHTTAAESFRRGEGVCQDYAQVLAVLCHLKGVPARYCMGITEGTGVTHAWTELHHQGKWLGIDPTRGCLADESYLRFSVGRDAQDCPVERGSFLGRAVQKQHIFASMAEE